MKSVRVSVLAAPGIVGLFAWVSPASANIIYGSQERPKWSRDYSASSENDNRNEFDWGTAAGSNSIFSAYSTVTPFQSAIDDLDRKAQAKRIDWRGPGEYRLRMPLTQQQLGSVSSSVADLGPSGDRPNAAAPGIFANYVPDLHGFADKGGGTTVPLPPAFVLAAVGLALAEAARRLGWGQTPSKRSEAG